MFESILKDWGMILFPLAALGYFHLMRYLDNRFANRTPLSDEEYLTHMARSQSVSEYDIFCLASQQWHVPRERIDEDFKDYLVNDLMPYYVKDFVRKTRQAKS
jgi:hypothetical protein